MAPSVDLGGRVPLEYRPCAVHLHDGRVIERVYVVEEDAYISTWGVYPSDDRGKEEVRLTDVARIDNSAYRLPPHVANELYRRGESGMGYYFFGLRTRDGRVIPIVTGGAVDFLPPGLRTEDVGVLVDVPRPDNWSDAQRGAPYAWCLFRRK